MPAHHHQPVRSLAEVGSKLLGGELDMEPRAMAFNQRVRLENEAAEDALKQIDRNARGGSTEAGAADSVADSDEGGWGSHIHHHSHSHSNNASMPVARAQLKLA